MENFFEANSALIRFACFLELSSNLHVRLLPVGDIVCSCCFCCWLGCFLLLKMTASQNSFDSAAVCQFAIFPSLSSDDGSYSSLSSVPPPAASVNTNHTTF
jgi:hypothetical protein